MGGNANGVVRLKDVAAAAGLSMATVSDALNGKGRVPDRTRTRVQAIAREMGYAANPQARHLAKRRTGVIAIVVSETDAFSQAVTDFEYFMQLMQGATVAALKRGYWVVLGPSPKDARWQELSLDGAIVADPVGEDPTVELLERRRVPVVTTGRDVLRSGGHVVDNDHDVGVPRLLDHLVRMGARRPALISTPPVHSYTSDIIASYERWSERHGLEPMIEVSGNGSEHGGHAAALSLLRRDPKIDAIHATFDRLGLGALLAARECGRGVPDDLLVSGSTDSAATRASDPSLTIISFRPQEVGEAAASMLIDLIEDPKLAERTEIVPTQLMVRASTRREPYESGAAATPRA